MELENANISMLMPQPFSQRHPSYLQRYTSSGDPHIIDKVQEVVALHKIKGAWLFLGSGALSCGALLSMESPQGEANKHGTRDSVRWQNAMKSSSLGSSPFPVSMDTVRVWVAPNGIVLCADQQFSGLMGYPSRWRCASCAVWLDTWPCPLPETTPLFSSTSVSMQPSSSTAHSLHAAVLINVQFFALE
eukprot:scaffold49446_cov19-Tisochrysis_lutea.AAC.3